MISPDCFAITPRILNNIRRPESELSEYWSGTELSINDRPQIVIPGAAGSGTGRNAPQRQTAAPAEPPIAQEESQNHPDMADRASSETDLRPSVIPRHGSLEWIREKTAPGRTTNLWPRPASEAQRGPGDACRMQHRIE